METRQSKIDNFKNLISKVNACKACERMCYRKKILSENNGNINSKVLFIAEAPGRLGAECTGVPLSGDQTGRNFDYLLKHIEWKRNDIFITNSVLCNPQDKDGKNAHPTCRELKNCNEYLRRTIEIINPEVIVTLGAYALKALNYIEKHEYTLKEHVATQQTWNNKTLFPLYHMSQISMNIYRDMDQQKADFKTVLQYINTNS